MQRRKRRDGIWKWSSESLHAVAGSLRKKGWAIDLSINQEWLWDAVISELEFRRRRPKEFGPKCSCEFCYGPFEDCPPIEVLVQEGRRDRPRSRSVYRIEAASVPTLEEPT